jgi:hypothetical protein
MSSSTISDCGDYKISVDRLDNIIDSPVSFLKMDIEVQKWMHLREPKTL